MKHTLYVLNRTGHAPVAEWSPDNKVEIKTAAEVFGDLQKQSYHFFDATQPTDTKDEMTTFDPEAKEIIAFGQPQAG